MHYIKTYFYHHDSSHAITSMIAMFKKVSISDTDLPDDFFEVTESDVKMMYSDMQSKLYVTFLVCIIIANYMCMYTVRLCMRVCVCVCACVRAHACVFLCT